MIESGTRKSNLGIRIIFAVLGLVTAGVGISLFLYTGYGVDPASVFELGIGNVFHISYGTSAAIINVIILAIVFFIDKSYINISSFLAIFGIGYTADGCRYLLDLFIKTELHPAVKLVFVLAGLVIMALGVAIYIHADLGVGAIDLISEIISNKSGLSYRYVRMGGDIAFVAVGYFLGGAVGIGTVAAAFLLGPAVQFVRPSVHKFMDRFI